MDGSDTGCVGRLDQGWYQGGAESAALGGGIDIDEVLDDADLDGAGDALDAAAQARALPSSPVQGDEAVFLEFAVVKLGPPVPQLQRAARASSRRQTVLPASR